jgi:hypothetical protein
VSIFAKIKKGVYVITLAEILAAHAKLVRHLKEAGASYDNGLSSIFSICFGAGCGAGILAVYAKVGPAPKGGRSQL